MAKESVLTLAEKESIVIDRLIFHIIIQEDLQPKFLDELIMTPDQLTFFKNRLIDIAQGTQYLFLDKENNEVFKLAKKIIEDPGVNFLQSSKELTGSFKRFHTGNTNDGVFITALATIQETRKLVFLLKLDHKKVYEYKRKKNKALLEEVKNTFVEDRTAIQKVALIDISNYYIWDVLAYDRAKPSSITEYFSRYLSVNPRETPTKLTESAISLTHKWAVNNKKSLDPNQEISNYKNRAITYLKEVVTFETDQFINYVVYDENSSRKEELKDLFLLFLQENGLAGQSFPPNRNAITRKTEKHIRQTAEGVKIEWTGEPIDNGVSMPLNRNETDGLYHISIKTSEITNLQ